MALLFVLTMFGLVRWPHLERSARLPDAHTITGLALDADGTWWAGNDGRRFEGDAFRPAIIHLSADFQPLSAITVAESGTLQGVALVGSEIWAASEGARAIVRFSRSGALLGRIVLRAAPNGLASDGRQIAVSFAGERSVEFLRPDGTLVRRVKTFREPDQLTWSGGTLWYSTGANGSVGCAFSLSGERLCFKKAIAIEGIVVTKAKVFVANDGYFHNQRPKINQVLIFKR